MVSPKADYNFKLTILLAIFILNACTPQPTPPSPYIQPTINPNNVQLLAKAPPSNPIWTPEELLTLRDLWLGSLPPPPPDPSNAVAGDPRAAALGHRLFFDERLSANNQVACATCHRPDLNFTDGFPRSFGTRLTRRNALTIVGAAYSPWLLWDGHKDSLWAQAIEPLEHPDEQGYTRLHAIHLIDQEESYRAAYEAIFGPLPDLSDFGRFPDSGGPVELTGYRANWERMTPADQATATHIYVNLGKALAAYERLIPPGPAPYDRYVQAILESDLETMEQTLEPEAVAGLRLFIGPAGCIRCHHGPLFTDHQFHNTGLPLVEDLPPDEGRAGGLARALADEFNCLGPYSDVDEAYCIITASKAANREALVYQFKTPTLRNVAQTGPYMHTGLLATLGEVLAHYNQAPAAPLGQTELKPLHLSGAELDQLESFLRSLSGPLAAPPELLDPPASDPSGLK